MDKSFHLIIFSIQVFLVLSDNLNEKREKRDAKLSTPDLIKAYGYPSEVHTIITEDGYILETHRIANAGKQPVILMHGMLDSSTTWIMMGPKRSLGYILYDRNYDVWLLNARGNDYSTGHIKYQRNGKQHERKMYWNFSWHEIGKFDLKSTIDYVLQNTSHSKVQYIGHSQGATSFFVLTSERPEYNAKILLAAMMAPPVFLTHTENSFSLLLCEHLGSLKDLSDWIGLGNLSRDLNNMLLELPDTIVCSLDAIRNTQLCKHNFSPFAGNITQHVKKSMIPVLNAHTPAGASVKSLLHYGQLIRKPQFHQFDYGIENNMHIYNRLLPPDYNLKNCTAPVVIIYSDHDTLVSARDVRRLPNELSNVLAVHRVDDDTFNHLDFVWAMDAKELVYDYILDWMKIQEERQRQK